MRTINLRQLRYFAAAIRAGSISKAAEEIQLAQTALSIQIRDLEKTVGVKLLERHSRGVLPTKAGAVLNERIGELEGFLERTLKEVHAANAGVAKTLSIGLNPSIMRLVGADLLLIAASASPPISIRLVEELSYALRDAMERGELDLAFAYDLETRPGLLREPVAEDELLFVTSAANATGTGPIGFTEVAKHELFFAGTKGIVSLVTQTAERMSLTPKIVADVQSVPAIRVRIAEGGASLLPYGTVADGVQNGTFAIRQVERPALTRTLYMIRRAGDTPAYEDPQVSALLRQMIQILHEQSAPYSRIIDSRFNA